MSHFGEISADHVYHVDALRSIMRYKDRRTAIKELELLGVNYRKAGKNVYVAGSDFLRAIEGGSGPNGETFPEADEE